MYNHRKVILYIATSLDGFIAKPNDDLSFLSIVEKVDEDYGYANFINTVDTVIIGRKTYDWILKQVPEFVHNDKITYVITRNARESMGNTHFYTGNLKALIQKLKSESGKDIFVDGGAEVVNALLTENLIDEFIISIIPIFVGSGIRLFKEDQPEQKLKLVSTKQFETGLVQLQYTR